MLDATTGAGGTSSGTIGSGTISLASAGSFTTIGCDLVAIATSALVLPDILRAAGLVADLAAGGLGLSEVFLKRAALLLLDNRCDLTAVDFPAGPGRDGSSVGRDVWTAFGLPPCAGAGAARAE